MPYLTHEQIGRLYDESLKECEAVVRRTDSKVKYKLLSPHDHGDTAVVWRVSDDLGNCLALKIIPVDPNHNLLDEMTEATKLNPTYFARIAFFGDLLVDSVVPAGTFKAIATEWLDGKRFDEFVKAR